MQLLSGRLGAPSAGSVTAPASRPLDVAALYATHHGMVYRTAYRIVGQAEDAEDVLQTVFLQLVRQAGGAEIANAGGYLHRLTVNAALNVLRHRRRHPAAALAPDGGAEPADPAGGPAASGPRAAAAAVADPAADHGDPTDAELRARLRGALGELPSRAAEIFALRYVEGLTNRQIADLFGTSDASIGVTLHRARQRVRAALAPLAGGDDAEARP